MSKSLKNFLTIRDTLEVTSAAQLRLMFLLHQWDTVLDYSTSSITEAKTVETTIQNFLTNVLAVVNDQQDDETGTHNYNQPEADLIELLGNKQAAVRVALCDSFNTPQVMTEIRALIASANLYIADKQKSKSKPNPSVLLKIGQYVTKMMRLFGVFEDTNELIGSFGSSSAGNTSSQDMLPVLKTMSNFRDEIRRLAQNGADSKTILGLCDKFRDDDLIEHGIVLEDREGNLRLIRWTSPCEVGR